MNRNRDHANRPTVNAPAAPLVARIPEPAVTVAFRQASPLDCYARFRIQDIRARAQHRAKIDESVIRAIAADAEAHYTVALIGATLCMVAFCAVLIACGA